MRRNLIPIERKDGVTLYGRIVDHKTKKLGQFEVYSDILGHDSNVYSLYSDAEKRFNALIGHKSSN